MSRGLVGRMVELTWSTRPVDLQRYDTGARDWRQIMHLIALVGVIREHRQPTGKRALLLVEFFRGTESVALELVPRAFLRVLGDYDEFLAERERCRQMHCEEDRSGWMCPTFGGFDRRRNTRTRDPGTAYNEYRDARPIPEAGDDQDDRRRNRGRGVRRRRSLRAGAS